MTDLPASLPLAQRLALSYAPRQAREATLTLLLLDNRLAAIMRRGGEPMIAQMKLAWWRDRFSEDPARWPKGEPLLARLRDWPSGPRMLVPLVDGWERLLDEQLDHTALEEFAGGRAAGWRAIETSDAVEAAGRQWALADLALHLSSGPERDFVEAAVRAFSVKPHLPRSVRALAVLRALSLRALYRDGAELLDSPRAAMLALRVGLTGR